MSDASFASRSTTAPALDRRVRAELVRIAYHDSLYGAPFGILVALIFGYATFGAFPARIVVPWLGFALACNALRLVSRWAYVRQPVPPEQTERWARIFIAVSALTG